MIEKKAAVDRLDEILDVPGIDMVQWGPSDYSMSIGKAGERSSPETQAAAKRVFETCLKKGIHPRAEIGGPEDAKRYLDMGVKHFCMDTDIALIYRTLKKNGEELRQLLG
jgi:4-hydroxy-2-oxoheptanedioate aldolase